MASNSPPAHSDIRDQPPAEDPLPAYTDVTNALDLWQDGLSTQTQVGGQLLTLLACYILNLPRDQMTAASTSIYTRPTRSLPNSWSKFTWPPYKKSLRPLQRQHTRLHT